MSEVHPIQANSYMPQNVEMCYETSHETPHYQHISKILVGLNVGFPNRALATNCAQFSSTYDFYHDQTEFDTQQQVRLTECPSRVKKFGHNKHFLHLLVH